MSEHASVLGCACQRGFDEQTWCLGMSLETSTSTQHIAYMHMHTFRRHTARRDVRVHLRKQPETNNAADIATAPGLPKRVLQCDLTQKASRSNYLTLTPCRAPRPVPRPRR